MLLNSLVIVTGILCLVSLMLSLKYFKSQRTIIEMKSRELDKMICTHDCETCKLYNIYSNDTDDVIMDFLENPGDDILNKFKGLDRLLISNTKTIIIYVLGAGIACAGLLYSIIHLITIIYHAGISNFNVMSCAIAKAAMSNKSGINGKLFNNINYNDIANIIVMLVICLAFLWSFGVALHSTDKERVKNANDYVKMLLGFLIGTAKSYLLGG